MNLDRVEVRNFRSIASLTIGLEPRCRVLVGVNESGKSNILAALALLDANRPINASEIREPGPDEGVVDTAHVWFVFRLNQDERFRVAKAASAAVHPAGKSIVYSGKSWLTAEQFALAQGEALYVVNLITKKRSPSVWSLKGRRIAEGWLRRNSPAAQHIRLENDDGGEIPTSVLAIHKSVVSDEFHQLFEKFESSDLSSLFGAEAKEIVREQLPECVYWAYSDANLLPSQIDISSFLNQPESCKPLAQMFSLAGYEDPKTAFETARQRSSQGVRNLLEKIALKATQHIKEVWSDCGNISISLRENGTNIDASIRDELNHYSLDTRSDGFKRFVTFLLLISARERADEFSNCLYLQDEPDLGLHPSGVRYLRDELIRISGLNYVVVSTHSIFMIDKERIDRHAIVEKTHEQTNLVDITSSNILDEEVIFNALGHSVFEQLKAENIVFEGWRDKRLFLTFIEGAGSKLKRAATHKKHVGVCHARGVRDVPRVISLLDLAGRKHFVMSDGDAPALEQERKHRAENGNRNWTRYDTLVGKEAPLTAEDFLLPQKLQGVLSQILKNQSTLTLPDEFFKGDEPAVAKVSTWLLEMGLDKSEAKRIVDLWKSGLFDSLRFVDIRKGYAAVAQGLIDLKF